MTESARIRTEVDGRVLKIVVDNVRKKNAFVPEMMVALADAPTAFDRDDEQWVAVLCAAGEHTTAGLDVPKFFGSTATVVPYGKHIDRARLMGTEDAKEASAPSSSAAVRFTGR
jgi:enoyl-CoA hydratase/carnithine racemase